MGKSKLADAFGKECPMINFVLRDVDDKGYPPPDTEILVLTRMERPHKFTSIIQNSPKKKKKHMEISEIPIKVSGRNDKDSTSKNALH